MSNDVSIFTSNTQAHLFLYTDLVFTVTFEANRTIYIEVTVAIGRSNTYAATFWHSVGWCSKAINFFHANTSTFKRLFISVE